MIINTNTHLSDSADSVTFEKNTTIFKNDKSVNNLQDVVEKFNDISVNGNKKATTKYSGLVKIGGTDNTDVIGTNTFLRESIKIKSSEKDYGVVKFSGMGNVTNANIEFVITPKTYKAYLNSRKSTETLNGSVKFATNDEIVSRKGRGVVTPKDLRHALNTMVPKEEPASETKFGIVRTVSSVDLYGKAKDYDVGYVITPKTIRSAIATTSRNGMVKYTKNWEDDKKLDMGILTPKSLISFKNNISKLSKRKDGFPKLLADNKNRFEEDAERIAKEIIERRKLELMDGIMAVGDITMVSGTSDTAMLKSLNGQRLSTIKYKKLFDIVGYKYGGSGDYFNLPDARGMILKMYGKGSMVTGPLGNIKSYDIGDFLHQGVAPHKHAGFGYNVNRTTWGFYLGSKRPYELPEKYRTTKGLWGTGRTLNSWYHGSRTRATKNCVLRYSDMGSQHGSGTENEDTRPWNLSLNFMMRVI